MTNRKPYSLKELAVVIGVLALLGLVMLPMLRSVRENQHRISCANNLKQWGLIFKMYQVENWDVYPPSSYIGLDGNLPRHWVEASVLYPDCWVNPMIALCPVGDDLQTLRRHGFSEAAVWQGRIIDAVDANQREVREKWYKGRQRGDQTERPLPADEDVLALLSLPKSYTYCAWYFTSQSQLADIMVSKLKRARQTVIAARGTVSAPSASTYRLSWCRWPAAVGSGPLPSTASATGGKSVIYDETGEVLPEEYDHLRAPLDRSIHGDSQWVRDYYESRRLEGQGRVVMWDSWGDGGHTFENLGVTTVERRPGHRNAGCNMLFYDGHVEFVPFGRRIAYDEGAEGSYGENLGAAMALAAGSVTSTVLPSEGPAGVP